MAPSVEEEASGERSAGTTLEIVREKPCAAWNVEGGGSAMPPVRTVAEGETVVVGSGEDAAIRVFDAAVSARHCALSVQGGELAIRDLGSKNGTFVGGARVESARLGSGSSFVLGRVVMSCSEAGRAIAAANGDVQPLPGVVGGSLAMRRVAREIRRLVDLKGPVLLRGETGSGKDVVARALHALGNRRG